MIEVKIGSNDQNKRLDNFVKKYLGNAPISFIYKLFRKKDIKVNGKHQNMTYMTKQDDIISIYISKQQADEFIKGIKVETSTSQDFSIIYEDENVLIVNKPAELLVHDGDVDKKGEDTLTKQVLNYLISTNAYNPNNESTFIPSLAHRIDRNTSGVIVFGKNILALQELFKAFKEHSGIDKKYQTLVCGKLANSGRIDAPLIKNEKTKIVNVDIKKGLPSTSLYKSIKVYQDCSLVEVSILTGRTHQIRVHMKYIDHPLVGDQKYGNANSDALGKKYKLRNYFLHAKSICFHNLQGNMSYLNDKEFVAPLYKWQLQLIERLNDTWKNIK